WTSGLGPGEWLTLAASVLFSVQILLLDRVGRRVESAHLTFGFFGITGLLAAIGAALWAAMGPGVGAWVQWTATMLQSWDILRALVLLTLLCTVVAFHWMNVYQPRV